MQKTSRRAFLAGLATTAGCSALDGAADAVAVDTASTQRIDEKMSVLISDMHAPQPWSTQKYRTGREYPWVVDSVRRLVKEIVAMRPLPAYVFGFGDVSIAFSEDRDYEIAAELLKPLEDAGIKIVMTVGNHDLREPFLKYLGRWVGKTPVPGRVASVTSLPDFDMILLDSLKEPKPEDRGKYPALTGYELGDAQKKWLEKTLAESKRPTLVGAHHMAGPLGITKTIVRAPTVFGYLHGHNHKWEQNYLFSGYSRTTVVRSQGLPSFGLDRDIGYAILRSYPDRAELEYVARDYYFPEKVPPAERPPLWDDIVRDNTGRRVTFPFKK